MTRAAKQEQAEPKVRTVTEDSARASETRPQKASRPKEIGGPAGPEPTRYGDWERAGRCVDF